MKCARGTPHLALLPIQFTWNLISLVTAGSEPIKLLEKSKIDPQRLKTQRVLFVLFI
jgi:hypothetical protein